MNTHQIQHRLRSCAPVALLALLAGCGSAPDPEELTELELVPTRPETREIDFGMYNVPVPGQTLDEEQGEVLSYNYLQLRFKLVGIVEPNDESETTRLAERHRGELRDRVINVCRNASLQELQDPELVTLKLSLIDATQPVFEGIVFDTVLIRDYMIESL